MIGVIPEATAQDPAAIILGNSAAVSGTDDFNVTWTSRGQSEPQFLANSSSLIGDHVVITATYLETAGLTGPFVTNLTIIGGPEVIYAGAEGLTLSFDTYANCSNGTYTLIVNTTDSLAQQVSCTFENVFIGNYFAPNVDNVLVDTVEPSYHNITWTCGDQNADDLNFFSVWISTDSGTSYIRIANNLTTTFYAWNSTGWLDTNFIVRVRAYSVDLNLFAGPFVNIPADYVPGDYADAFSPSFTPSGPWITFDVGVISPGDITLSVGSTAMIEWEFTFTNGNWMPGYVEYSITIMSGVTELYVYNDIISFSGPEDQVVQYTTLMHEEAGTYFYILSFHNPGPTGGTVSDEVAAIIQALPPDAPILGPILLSIISVWGLAGVLVIVILIKNRR